MSFQNTESSKTQIKTRYIHELFWWLNATCLLSFEIAFAVKAAETAGGSCQHLLLNLYPGRIINHNIEPSPQPTQIF